MRRDQLFNSYFEQVRSVYQPWQKVNNVVLSNMEKTIQFQLEVAQRYSHIGTERLKAANDIREIEDLQSYASRQAELFSQWTEQVMDDARTLTELGMKFREELSKAFSEAGDQTAQQLDELTQQANEASQQVLDSVQSATETAADEAKDTASEATKAASDTAKSSANRASSSSSSRSSSSSNKSRAS